MKFRDLQQGATIYSKLQKGPVAYRVHEVHCTTAWLTAYDYSDPVERPSERHLVEIQDTEEMKYLTRDIAKSGFWQTQANKFKNGHCPKCGRQLPTPETFCVCCE